MKVLPPQGSKLYILAVIIPSHTHKGYVYLAIILHFVEQCVLCHLLACGPHAGGHGQKDGTESHGVVVLISLYIGEHTTSFGLYEQLVLVLLQGEPHAYTYLVHRGLLVYSGHIQPALIFRDWLYSQTVPLLHVLIKLVLVLVGIVPVVRHPRHPRVPHEYSSEPQPPTTHVRLHERQAVPSGGLGLEHTPVLGGFDADVRLPSSVVTFRPYSVEEDRAINVHRVYPRHHVPLGGDLSEDIAKLMLRDHDFDQVISIGSDGVGDGGVVLVGQGRRMPLRYGADGVAQQVVDIVTLHLIVEEHGPWETALVVGEGGGGALQFTAVPPCSTWVLYPQTHTIPAGVSRLHVGRRSDHPGECGWIQEPYQVRGSVQGVHEGYQILRWGHPACWGCHVLHREATIRRHHKPVSHKHWLDLIHRIGGVIMHLEETKIYERSSNNAPEKTQIFYSMRIN